MNNDLKSEPIGGNKIRYYDMVLGPVICFVPTLEARKLLSMETKKKALSLEDSLFLSALPKGTIPPSSPSKKGHAMIINEKLFALPLASIDRILRSVPSPGIGHD
ncbi:hypothetical protein HHK36_001703 [Tetracentron sinense]|uniref:Uncharacterized protein n=1 Tax=Tetracentron sinense TaxID=13715 RepID=A0A834ZUH6_TETSI|nr:hypothetical protein HHK36_001703 [Tetracentron sinense]